MNSITKAKRGQISPYQLFFVLFVSRIVVSLTYVQTVSVGELGTDFLFSIALSYILTMLLSVPIFLCCKSNLKVVFQLLYSIYFIWLSAVNINRFSYFASSRINPDSSMVFFIIAIVIASCYCAIMGVEGISRFGSFCGILLLITVFFVLVFNLHNLSMINYYPVNSNSRLDVFKNAFVMTSNSAEASILLILSNKVNGEKIKAYMTGMTASYITIFILIAFVIGIMGNAATLQSYPIFTLFQMASAGSFSRLDMLHTAFWVLALLLKSSVFIYASSVVIKNYKHSTKCIAVSLALLGVSLFITLVLGTAMVGITKIVSVVTFLIFVVALPLITLIVRRKNIEKN